VPLGESAEISSANSAITMRIKFAESAASPLSVGVQAFRMLYDCKIAIRGLKSLDTSEFKFYNILWPKNM
jgi:hypothetical protein